jgi:NADH-quinone oxidoreductase subunit J
MHLLFYIAAAVAVLSTARVVTQANAVHALLYLIVSLLSVALIFFLLGAPFIAALEIIVYAGAIMVLFVFVIMMLNAGSEEPQSRKALLRPATWLGPVLLAVILLTELAYLLWTGGFNPPAGGQLGPRVLGQALFGPYILGVELASILLMAGLVGAYHLARPAISDATQGDLP